MNNISAEGIEVLVAAGSACHSCHSKELCSLSGSHEKMIMVPGPAGNLKKGDPVEVVMEESLGLLAVLFAYVLPVFFFLACLLILVETGLEQVAAGLISLLVMTMYFFILYLYRNNLKKNFRFSIIRKK